MVAVAATALAFSGLALWWLVAEVDGVERGSLAWYVVLPGYLQAMPTPQACDAPLYAFHGIDGARPQVAAVRFRTRLDRDGARAAYAPLLTACRAEDTGPLMRWRCEGRDYGEVEIELDAAAQDGCRRIEVRLIAR